VRAVVMVLVGRFRQHRRSWLALSVLIAVAGGFVLAAAAAGRRTAAAFPDFVARHGYDIVVYSGQPPPHLAALPDVASVTPVLAPFSGQPQCASCRKQIDASNFLIDEVPPRQLPRMVALLSGRMPDQSRPGEVLASYTLAQENGVRVGSVIRTPLYSQSQLETGSAGKSPPLPPPPLQPPLRVVGIVAAQGEFQTSVNSHYDLFATRAFAAAVNHRAALLSLSYVRLRDGEAGLAAFHSRLRSSDVLGIDDLDADADAVESSIRPQVIGWYVLAGLAALAALAVIAQAIARQAATERADHRALSALGMSPRGFVLLSMLRTTAIGAAGAVGAAAIAVMLSPLTPVGEARLADHSPGGVSVDPVVLLAGSLTVLAVVTALSAWPAVRYARLSEGTVQRATPTAAVGRAAAAAGLPPSALIGIRHAVERGRGGQPVAAALLGMVLAVAALCATAVFGASLAHLVSSPALYGSPFRAYFAPDGTPGSASLVTGPLLDSLRRDPAIEQITLAAYEEIAVNGHHVPTFAVTPVRGPALLSAVDGRRPRGDREIMLGAATMRTVGARLGGFVRVTVTDPAGRPRTARFRVIGRASLNAGAGGTGNGSAMTISALVGAQCGPGSGQPACQRAARHGIDIEVLVRAAPGPAGDAALARHIRKYRSLAYRPGKPTALVNFGESVSFPLLFGVALSLFGAATMMHLLLVSVARRRQETGLLKVLGFVRRQVGAAVCWQASSVALVGIAVGAPIGIAAGKVLWRVFATNFGVVPVEVVRPVLLVVLVTGVLVAANVLAAVPALLAARSRPGQLLRAE
jgi:hypothetical protein